MIDLVSVMGRFPQNYAQQLEWFNRFIVYLQQINTSVINNAGAVVTLNQTTEPTQAEWEAAWTAQVGTPLPIPASGDLYWWNTSVDKLGGVYGTIEGSSTVFRRDHLYPRGGTVVFETAYKTDQVSSLTYAIGANLTHHPSVTITLPVKADLIMEYSLMVGLVSGTGQWGIDFFINGVKAGTQYLGLTPNQGIVNSSVSGNLRAIFTLSDAEPGEYIIQAAFGVTASPATSPTLSIGGVSGANSYGARLLTVRGIAK